MMLLLCILTHGVVAWASQQNTADQDAALQQNGTQVPAGKAKPLPQPVWPGGVPAIPAVAPNVALALQQQWALLQQMMNSLNQHPPPPLQLPRPNPPSMGKIALHTAPCEGGSSVRRCWHATFGSSYSLRQSRCSTWLPGARTGRKCQCNCRSRSSQPASSCSSSRRDSRPRQSLQPVACQSSSGSFQCRCSTGSQRQRRVTAIDCGPLAGPHQQKPRKV